MQPTVRPATLSDSESLAALSTELGYPSSTENVHLRLRQILQHKDNRVLVSQLDDEMVVGCIHIFGSLRLESDAFAEIGSLVVLPAFQRQGVGKVLVKEAELWAADNGYNKIRIRSHVLRVNAHRFFETMAFKKLKTQEVFVKIL